jgi:hypothetical protein
LHDTEQGANGAYNNAEQHQRVTADTAKAGEFNRCEVRNVKIRFAGKGT